VFPKLLPVRVYRIVAILGLACGALGFCQKGFGQTPAPSASRQDAAPSVQPSLTETQWNLTEVEGEAVTARPPDSQPYIYLQEPADKISGSGGCNRLFGSFDLSGSSLQFHSIASTLMACTGSSGAHEPALLDALKLTTSYEISGNTLQLKMDDRVLARFQARKK
jgi:heat shock protein HslJ